MRPFFDFLGELLAPLLDIIYSSDEKDKVFFKTVGKRVFHVICVVYIALVPYP